MAIARATYLAAGPLALVVLATAPPAVADLVLGTEEFAQAGGIDIHVPGYSVPSLVAWDGDALPDLIIGDGDGGTPDARVRVYRNVGTASSPEFADYTYVQSNGVDLIMPGGG